MTHPRQTIREAFKAVLLNQTAAADRVMSNRPNPLSQRPTALGGKEELPAILIYTRNEQSEVFDESPRRYRRTAEVVVELAMEVGPATNIDDDLDAFAEQIENLVLADDSLGGVANDTTLSSTSTTVTDPGAKLIGAAILTFDVEYFSYAPAEGTQSVDDLSTLHTEYSLEGKQGDPQDRAITHLEDLEQ